LVYTPPRGLAKGIALKSRLWLATAVSVVLAVASAQAAPSFPSAPHVRGAIHIHGYRGGWGHHHGWGWGPWAWLGSGAGIVAGAIIADEAYRPHPGHYYDEGPYDGPYYYPSHYGGDPREICAESSFEWETGFYTTYSGERRVCPYLTDALPPPAATPPYGAAPPPPGAVPYRDAGPPPPAAVPYRDPGLPRPGIARLPYDVGPPPGAGPYAAPYRDVGQPDRLHPTVMEARRHKGRLLTEMRDRRRKPKFRKVRPKKKLRTMMRDHRPVKAPPKLSGTVSR
jgi:hypothetical protein